MRIQGGSDREPRSDRRKGKIELQAAGAFLHPRTASEGPGSQGDEPIRATQPSGRRHDSTLPLMLNGHATWAIFPVVIALAGIGSTAAVADDTRVQIQFPGIFSGRRDPRVAISDRGVAQLLLDTLGNRSRTARCQLDSLIAGTFNGVRLILETPFQGSTSIEVRRGCLSTGRSDPRRMLESLAVRWAQSYSDLDAPGGPEPLRNLAPLLEDPLESAPVAGEPIDTLRELPLPLVRYDTLPPWKSPDAPFEAPFPVLRVDTRTVELDLGLREAPPLATLLDSTSRTAVGRWLRTERRCEPGCDGDTTRTCHGVGVYDAPRPWNPLVALGGRWDLENVRRPHPRTKIVERRPDGSVWTESVWGRFRSHLRGTWSVLTYDRTPLVRTTNDNAAPVLDITHAFRHQGREYYLVATSETPTHCPGLLFPSPRGWQYLQRPVEPEARAEICW